MSPTKRFSAALSCVLILATAPALAQQPNVIDQNITPNGRGVITAPLLNSVLHSIQNGAANANNLSSGTLPPGRLPMPTLTTPGGAYAAQAGAHQFGTGISIFGLPTFAQPAAGDVSGLAASATVDTTNAGNIGSGLLPLPRLSYTPGFSGGTASAFQAILDRQTNVDDYGAVGDGATDDSGAFGAAGAHLAASCGTVALTPGKRYYVSTLALPPCVAVQGAFPGAGNNTAPQNASAYNTAGAILVPSTGTIKLTGSSVVRDALIVRAGMTFPAANATAFAGTALTCDTAGHPQDVTLQNVLVLGFNKALSCQASDRLNLRTFAFDAVNGIDVANSQDSASLEFRGWPYASVGAAGGVQNREGTCFKISGAADDTRIPNALCDGYLTNFDFEAAGNVTVGKLWSDQVVAHAGSIGVLFGGNFDRSLVDQIISYGSVYNVLVNNGAGHVVISDIMSDASLSGECMTVQGGSVFVKTILFPACKLFALDIQSATAVVTIGTGTILNSNGGAGNPYIAIPSGGNLGKIKIGPIVTDQTAGASLYGSNNLLLAPLTGAATLSPDSSSDRFTVNGTAATTTIQGTWGGREITFVMAGTGTFTSGGNLALASGASFPTGGGAAGSQIRLMFDATAAVWREEWRSHP